MGHNSSVSIRTLFGIVTSFAISSAVLSFHKQSTRYGGTPSWCRDADLTSTLIGLYALSSQIYVAGKIGLNLWASPSERRISRIPSIDQGSAAASALLILAGPSLGSWLAHGSSEASHLLLTFSVWCLFVFFALSLLSLISKLFAYTWMLRFDDFIANTATIATCVWLFLYASWQLCHLEV